jgi:hypothetical protein
MPNKRNKKKPNTAAFTRAADAAVYLHVTRNTVVEQVLASERMQRAQAWSHDQARKSQQRERPFKLRPQSFLTSLIRERQSHEQFERAERRRRNGFLPSREELKVQHRDVPIIRHPPGWILTYGSETKEESFMIWSKDTGTKILPICREEEKEVFRNKETGVLRLQDLALHVFADHLEEYFYAMGTESLHAAMAVLPPETLAELSILVSIKKRGGVNDHLAILMAKHGHVDQICLRAAAHGDEDEAKFGHDRKTDEDGSEEGYDSDMPLSSKTLTDQGVLALMHQVSVKNYTVDAIDDDSVPDCWEDNDSDSEAELDSWELHASAVSGAKSFLNIKLRRLELLDCQRISATVLLKLFERCSGITHLSLAGSFVRSPQDGIDVLLNLPLTLPNLQVLDVTRCPWVAFSLLTEVMTKYNWQREGSDVAPPKFHSQEMAEELAFLGQGLDSSKVLW